MRVEIILNSVEQKMAITKIRHAEKYQKRDQGKGRFFVRQHGRGGGWSLRKTQAEGSPK